MNIYFKKVVQKPEPKNWCFKNFNCSKFMSCISRVSRVLLDTYRRWDLKVLKVLFVGAKIDSSKRKVLKVLEYKKWWKFEIWFLFYIQTFLVSFSLYSVSGSKFHIFFCSMLICIYVNIWTFAFHRHPFKELLYLMFV